MAFLDFLKGKKTYALSALTVAAVAAGMANGKISTSEGVAGIALALGVGTNRAGSKSDADKVIAHVTDVATIAAAAAPLVAKTVPGLAAAADDVAKVAEQVAETRAAPLTLSADADGMHISDLTVGRLATNREPNAGS